MAALVTMREGLWRELKTARALLLWLPVWLVIGFVLAALVAAYQVPHTYPVDVGSPQDQLYVRNFHARIGDDLPTYRWSGVYGYVSFPGTGGSRPFTATITLDPVRTAPVEVIVNGQPVFSDTLHAGWQTLLFSIDDRYPAALASRDTVVEVRAPDFRTPDLPTQPKGLRLDSVQIEQAAHGGFITPPYLHTGVLLMGVLLAYFFVGRASWGVISRSRSRGWGAVVASIGGLALALLVAQSHVGVAAASTHIVVTLASMAVLLIVCDFLLRRNGARRAHVQGRMMAFCLALAFGLRYGGMALPQSVIIDMPWHMKWLTTLLAGDWQSLYFPGGLSSVPQEWGLEVLIPKSPLFYFAAAPLRLLPTDLETSVKWLVCLMDALVVLAVFWMGARVSGSRWAGVTGAALYAMMPLAFRAFSYGILPTIFAQWLAVAVILSFILLGEGRMRPAHWLSLAALLTLALLAFPTVAVFLTFVLLVSAVGWWVIARRSGLSARLTARALILLPIAWLLALWAYYGLYVSPVLASASALIASTSEASTVRWSGGWAHLIAWTSDYIVSVLPVLLGAVGLLFLLYGPTARGQHEVARRQALLVLGVWFSVLPLFMLLNYRMDMIGKHLFFTMLPVAALGGVALWKLAARGRWGVALVASLLGVIAWQGLTFWVERLVRAST